MSVPSRRRPGGPPASAGVLAKYAQAYARESGVALELRLRERARATKDIDLVLHDAVSDLVAALEHAITADAADPQTSADGSVAGAVAGHAEHQGFQFQRRREPIVLDNGTINVELAATYRGGSWTTISVDIARAEPGEAEVELLDAIAFEDALGIIGPARVPCLPLRYQIAQKLHGMTLPPRHGKRNERFKDLIDLMLTEALVSDYAGLREACEELFESRATHAWPPPLDLPEHWREGYAKFATDLQLSVTDAAEAMERVRAMVARIQAASCKSANYGAPKHG